MASVTDLAPQQRWGALGAAREALAGLDRALAGGGGVPVADGDLRAWLGLCDEVAALAGAARAAVVVEAVRRGVPAAEGQQPVGWVREHAPSLRQGGAGQLAALAVAVGEAARGSGLCLEGAGEAADDRLDPETPLGVVWGKVRLGELGVPVASAVLREEGRIAHRMTPGARHDVTEAMCNLGAQWGPGMVARMRCELLARYGAQGELDAEHDRLAATAFLSAAQVRDGELTEYRMGLTPEQAARLEAALGPLSRPRPNPETGERDLRPNTQRRAEALTELAARASAMDRSAGAGRAPDGPGAATHGSDGPALASDAGEDPTRDDRCDDLCDDRCDDERDPDGDDRATGAGSPPRPWAASGTLYVTMNLTDLLVGTGCGRALGTVADGTILSPEAVRILACQADLVPVVLGTQGEVLDVGHLKRLYTPGQRRALLLRDRCCTYPGCDAPASWAKAHHVWWWWDGGPTDLDNAALLCQLHHSHVHRKRLWATVTTQPDTNGHYVTWDLTPGSYDHALARLKAAA